METKLIGGYARVSGQKLKSDGERRQDVQRQVDKIKQYCKIMNLSEPILFIDDGISAFKDDYNSRPSFCKMLNEVKANRIKHIIIEDLTRWSRRLEDGLKTLSEVNDKCKVTSLSEGEVGTDIPEKWFKTAIGFLMAEWASRSMAYKVSSGMDRRLNDKKKICSSCGIVHLGRHPKTCNCDKCLKIKGRLKLSINSLVSDPTKSMASNG
jgi:predicted site-specific integrase-resolvase